LDGVIAATIFHLSKNTTFVIIIPPTIYISVTVEFSQLYTFSVRSKLAEIKYSLSGIDTIEDTAAECSDTFDRIVQVLQLHMYMLLQGVSPPENRELLVELGCRQVTAEVCPKSSVTS
jgi:hypothetical protein